MTDTDNDNPSPAPTEDERRQLAAVGGIPPSLAAADAIAGLFYGKNPDDQHWRSLCAEAIDEADLLIGDEFGAARYGYANDILEVVRLALPTPVSVARLKTAMQAAATAIHAVDLRRLTALDERGSGKTNPTMRRDVERLDAIVEGHLADSHLLEAVLAQRKGERPDIV